LGALRSANPKSDPNVVVTDRRDNAPQAVVAGVTAREFDFQLPKVNVQLIVDDNQVCWLNIIELHERCHWPTRGVHIAVGFSQDKFCVSQFAFGYLSAGLMGFEIRTDSFR